MTRGEVWWAELPEPIGRRPVVLLSRPEAYSLLTAVIVAEVTTRRRAAPTHVPLSARDGLDRPCAVNLDAVHTLPRARLAERIATLSSARLGEVEDALRFSLALD